MSEQRRVAIVGSGNWGSAIAAVIGGNLQKEQSKFYREVRMWTFEELINGRKLTDIINQDHENVKYLPGHKLPENVIAEPDILKATEDADLLVFVLPNQIFARSCEQLVGKVKSGAIALSLVKGLNYPEPGKIGLISDILREQLGVEVGVLMGANIANEVAAGSFCEATIAFKNVEHGRLFRDAIQTENFRVTVVNDVANAELSGALKNIVAFAAGLIDGLYGEKARATKAAVIRLGIMEMIDFAEKFFPGGSRDTFLESCGVADVITSSFGGHNRKCAEAFAKQPHKTLKQLEDEMFSGYRLQGPATAAKISRFLQVKGRETEFPMFTIVHRVCMKEMPAEDLLNGLRHGVWEDEWSLRTTVGGRLTIEVADNFSNYGRLMAAVSAENIPNIIAILPPVRELEYFEYSNLNSFLEIETGVFHIEMDVVGVREDMELVFAVVQAGEYDGYFRFRFNFH